MLLAAAVRASAADAKAPAGKLVHATGDVTIGSGSGGRLGKTGSSVENGDSVTTGDASTAVVQLPDGSRVKLRAGTRAVVTWPGPKNDSLTEVFLSVGSAFAKVTKRLAGQKFQVRTPTAVAAVRGTEFFTAYGRPRGKDKDLWVCVNEGSVELTASASKKPLVVPAGQGVLIKGGRSLTKPQEYDWTKKLNWNMDEAGGDLEDKTNLDAAYSDLLDQDYR